MSKKKKKLYIFILMLLLCMVFIPYALSKYSTTINKKITLNARQPVYDIVFNANAPTGSTVTGTMANQHFEHHQSQQDSFLS